VKNFPFVGFEVEWNIGIALLLFKKKMFFASFVACEDSRRISALVTFLPINGHTVTSTVRLIDKILKTGLKVSKCFKITFAS
jgi:hypothetical protein